MSYVSQKFVTWKSASRNLSPLKLRLQNIRQNTLNRESLNVISVKCWLMISATMLTASKYLRLFHHLPIHLFELFKLVTYYRLKQRYRLSLLIYIDFLINFILQKSQEAVLKVLWSLYQSPLGAFQLTIIQSLLSQFLTCFHR